MAQWLIFALLAAVSASFVTIFTKIGISNECACSYYGYIFSGRFVQSGRLSPVKRACDVQAGCCIFNRGWNLWGTFMVIFKHRIENGKNMAGRAYR